MRESIWKSLLYTQRKDMNLLRILNVICVSNVQYCAATQRWTPTYDTVDSDAVRAI